MSVARPTQRRPATAERLVLGLVAAVGVHVAILGTVNALDLGLHRGPGSLIPGGDSAAAAAAGTLADLQSSCAGDAALTAAARSTACLAPWAGDVDGCLAGAAVAYQTERDACKHQSDPVAVTIVSMTKEDIARIDPEPLLELLSAAEQEKFKQQQQQQQEQQQQQVAKQQQQVAQAAQVVETAKPTVEVAPDQARFLSDYDTKVEHETVARGSRDEAMVAKSKPAELPTKANARDPSVAKLPPDRPPGTNEQAPDRPGKLSMRSPGAISPAHAAQEAKLHGRYDGVDGPLGDGLKARRGEGAIDRPRQDADETAGGGGAGGGAPAVPDLHPSEDVLERALGGGSVDHLESVDDGDETALNAKHWVYASFFNRLKRVVAQNWEPAQVWQRHDPSGAVYGYKTRVTEIRVSLDKHGKLAKPPTVVRPSGVDVLDDEAVRAFQASAPFPNPPDGLVQDDGLITFEFSFHFEIGAPRTSWRILRSM